MDLLMRKGGAMIEGFFCIVEAIAAREGVDPTWIANCARKEPPILHRLRDEAIARALAAGFAAATIQVFVGYAGARRVYEAGARGAARMGRLDEAREYGRRCASARRIIDREAA
jgi:hypothetical protein